VLQILMVSSLCFCRSEACVAAADGSREAEDAGDRVRRGGAVESWADVLLIRRLDSSASPSTAIPNVLFAACVLVVACRALDLT